MHYWKFRSHVKEQSLNQPKRYTNCIEVGATITKAH